MIPVQRITKVLELNEFAILRNLQIVTMPHTVRTGTACELTIDNMHINFTNFTFSRPTVNRFERFTAKSGPNSQIDG